MLDYFQVLSHPFHISQSKSLDCISEPFHMCAIDMEGSKASSNVLLIENQTDHIYLHITIAISILHTLIGVCSATGIFNLIFIRCQPVDIIVVTINPH